MTGLTVIGRRECEKEEVGIETEREGEKKKKKERWGWRESVREKG